MNFKEYFNKENPDEYSWSYDEYQKSSDAWEACKQEVLKLLKEDKLAYHEAVNSGTIEKIEKL